MLTAYGTSTIIRGPLSASCYDCRGGWREYCGLVEKQPREVFQAPSGAGTPCSEDATTRWEPTAAPTGLSIAYTRTHWEPTAAPYALHAALISARLILMRCAARSAQSGVHGSGWAGVSVRAGSGCQLGGQGCPSLWHEFNARIQRSRLPVPARTIRHI